MSTLAVVEEILREAAVPMSVREIVERAGDALPTKSKTPDTVVARDLSMDIKKKGDTSIFIRTSPGRYAVREVYMKKVADGQLQPPMVGPEATSVVQNAIQGERAGTRAAGRHNDAESSSSSSMA
jgi:hypothetical protein